MKTFIITTFARINPASEQSTAKQAPFMDVTETVSIMHREDSFIQSVAMASLASLLEDEAFVILDEAVFDEGKAQAILQESFESAKFPVTTPAIIHGNDLTYKWSMQWRDMLQFVRNKSS